MVIRKEAVGTKLKQSRLLFWLCIIMAISSMGIAATTLTTVKASAKSFPTSMRKSWYHRDSMKQSYVDEYRIGKSSLKEVGPSPTVKLGQKNVDYWGQKLKLKIAGHQTKTYKSYGATAMGGVWVFIPYTLKVAGKQRRVLIKMPSDSRRHWDIYTSFKPSKVYTLGVTLK